MKLSPVAIARQCAGELWKEPFTQAEIMNALAIMSRYASCDEPCCKDEGECCGCCRFTLPLGPCK